MSRRSNLLSILYKNIRAEAESTLTTAARNGINSLEEYIRASSTDPSRRITVANLFIALKNGVLTTGQPKAISSASDRSKRGSARK